MRGKKVRRLAITTPIPAARQPACVIPRVSGGGGGGGVLIAHAGGATAAGLAGETGPPASGRCNAGQHQPATELVGWLHPLEARHWAENSIHVSPFQR